MCSRSDLVVHIKEAETMNLKRETLFFAMIALLLSVFAFPAQASDADKLTYFTFSTPVELPGVALGSGTYAFKVLDSLSDRNIVQVFDKDQKHLYATILAIPDYTPQPSDKTIIRFSETKPGAPPAIKEWFYPGDSIGWEFVYPQSRAVQLAKASNQAVPSMPSNLSSNITDQNKSTQDSSAKAMENAPLKAEEPSGEEVEIAEVFIPVAPAGAPDNGNSTGHTVNTESHESATLPKTASMLPLIGVVGLSLVIMGALFCFLAKRTV